MRVFIGLTEVAGYFGNLAKGLRELGIETTFVDLYSHPFEYSRGAEAGDRLVDLHRTLSKRRASAAGGRGLSALWWAYLQKTCVLLILVRAAFSCDAFIFSSDTTFIRYVDLPVLRLLRKRIIFVFTGSDHRPSYMNGASVGSLDERSIAHCAALAKEIKAKLRRIERLADVVVGHHLCAHFHERAFIPVQLLGFPYTTTRTPLPPSGEGAEGMVRIVHAPSKPKHKGTAEIRLAIERLREKGHPIDFVELVNVPNDVVLDQLARCDFVVDELYSDTRMAGLATEAAFLGKPTVVGGYARDEDLAIDGVYSPSAFPPVQFCHPDRLEEAIEELITDVPYRLALGKRACEFVRTHWSPSRVAARYVALIDDKVPDGWTFDPRAIRYLHGTGMPESVARTAVGRLVDMFGIGALCLRDKPEMERAFLDFADADAEGVWR